ncbi:MAG: wax ester/triacylglycerol synthase domain-containing protein, partial [Mycolicibacterium sp.]
MFIYGETSSSKMHVAGLLPFTPPADAPRDYLRQMVDDARRQEVMPPWNRKLAYPRLQFSPLHTWVTDTEFDFDYHVRRSALASPGDERELGILVSRLHSNHLDLTRPPWELHVIEGLEGGRFALYMKIHHALVDGYTAMRMLGRSLSTDPQTRDARMFFNVA